MPRKQEWTIRVVNWETGNGLELGGLWTEQLRYMGHAKELAHFDEPARDVIEFYAPKGSDSKIWSEQNAARMRGFGIDAAAAPKWMDDRYMDGKTHAWQADPTDGNGPEAYQRHMERLNRPR